MNWQLPDREPEPSSLKRLLKYVAGRTAIFAIKLVAIAVVVILAGAFAFNYFGQQTINGPNPTAWDAAKQTARQIANAPGRAARVDATKKEVQARLDAIRDTKLIPFFQPVLDASPACQRQPAACNIRAHLRAPFTREDNHGVVDASSAAGVEIEGNTRGQALRIRFHTNVSDVIPSQWPNNRAEVEQRTTWTLGVTLRTDMTGDKLDFGRIDPDLVQLATALLEKAVRQQSINLGADVVQPCAAPMPRFRTRFGEMEIRCNFEKDGGALFGSEIDLNAFGGKVQRDFLR